MKLPFQAKYLPYITLGTGVVGMILRIWYLTSQDSKGLLPTFHLADTFCYILFATALVLIFLTVRTLPDEGKYHRMFPAGIPRCAGCGIGAITIIFSSLFDVIHKADLSVPALILGLLAAASLILLALCRYSGSRPSAFLLLPPVVYLMFHAVIQARLWSSETQASVLFFPFMASLFLLLHAYFLAALTVRQKGRRSYVFFNQATLLLCIISMSDDTWLFYLGMALWVGLDLAAFPKKVHRAQPEEEI